MMKVAVIGSRGLEVEHLEDYLPKDVTEIVSGGAKGVDTCARNYALNHGLKLTEFLPEYSKYGRGVSAISKCRFSPKWDVVFYGVAYRCYTALYTTSLAGLKPVKP